MSSDESSWSRERECSLTKFLECFLDLRRIGIGLAIEVGIVVVFCIYFAHVAGYGSPRLLHVGSVEWTRACEGWDGPMCGNVDGNVGESLVSQ
jgi:hypothetical protein